jgi:hypothetical protein
MRSLVIHAAGRLSLAHLFAEQGPHVVILSIAEVAMLEAALFPATDDARALYGSVTVVYEGASAAC